MAHLTAYPAYRDSGVPWLGKIPAHWNVRRQRNVVQMLVSTVDKHSIEGEIPIRLCNYVDVYKNDRISDKLAFMHATASQLEIDRFRLRIGDVIITKDSESWNDIGVPALVEYEAPDLVCGYHLAILRPCNQALTGDYLFRALQSQGVAVQYHVSANGVTRYGLSHEAIKSVSLPIPPPDEQAAIARFLDYVDRRIRRYIRAKRKLIALLEEQKQAIIHRAVTRGLDPDVRLKPSGVEWLGDIPKHWQAVSLSVSTHSIQTGPFGSQLHATDYVTEGIPVINPSHMSGGRIHFDPAIAISEQKAKELERHALQAGDLVMARRGELGRCALVCEGEAGWLCGTGSLRIRPKNHVYASEYLVLLLGSPGVRDMLNLSSIGATMDNLNAGMVGRLRLPCPPVQEQRQIRDYINFVSSKIQTALLGAQRQTDLIREYRTRLISDVVTGKLDVREAAAHLPGEAAEPEEVDDLEEMDEDENVVEEDQEEEA